MTKLSLEQSRKFSIAPMMDWTDRHCRHLHRLLTTRALLFTEMVTSAAIMHGDRERLLGFNAAEHPVAVQFGGSDPTQLAEAAKIAQDFAYDEINLNVGCPSDRVKSGSFGACLMAEPDLVARCVGAMKGAVSIPVTVKCRIGIDDQDVEVALDTLADNVIVAGADHLYVHARKAWLQGLSPKQNRDVPPLDYDRVYRLANRLTPSQISINGGVTSLDQTQQHLGHVSGVMMGRSAYNEPMILAQVDTQIFGEVGQSPDLFEILTHMQVYTQSHLASGGRVNQVTRHMLGLAMGRPGAKRFRQILSVEACRPDAGLEIFDHAAEALRQAEARAEEFRESKTA